MTIFRSNSGRPTEEFQVAIPFTVAKDDPAAGAGTLETPGSQDTFAFSVSEAQAAQGLLIESSCATAGYFRLREVASGQILMPTNLSCSSARYSDLGAGSYQVEVVSHGTAGPYTGKVIPVPPAQSFDYQVGQKVEPGKIAGTVVEGAGNLETTSSKDVYTFTVPEGAGTVVFDSYSYEWPLRNGSKLVEVATGKNWGAINGHHEWDLPAGDYRIEVSTPGSTGTYTFSSYLK